MLEPSAFTGTYPGAVLVKHALSNFDSEPLILDPGRFRSKNSQNRAKRKSIFPGKAREDRILILRYLDSPMAKVFPKSYLIFRF